MPDKDFWLMRNVLLNMDGNLKFIRGTQHVITN